MTTDLKLAVIIASSRPQRVGPAVAEWIFAATAGREHATYDLIDLAELELPNLDEPQPASTQQYTHEHAKAWSAMVASYDGFIFVTPEYNRGIPGQLKNALDSCMPSGMTRPQASCATAALAGCGPPRR